MRVAISLASLLFMYAAALGQTTIGGTASMGAGMVNPTISTPVITQTISSSPDSYTIVMSWTTASLATSGFTCVPSGGGSTFTSLGNGYQTALSFSDVVEGLTPSTAYNCTISASNTSGTVTSNFTATTTALPAYLAVTNVSIGAASSYNAINANNQLTGGGDTFYTACIANGTCYLTGADNHGFTQNGLPANLSSNMNFGVFTSLSPLAIITTNALSAYGKQASCNGSDTRSQKPSGLFAMANMIFLFTGRQYNVNCGLSSSAAAYPQSAGQVIWSPNNGGCWNNFQAVGNCVDAGLPSSPPAQAFFGTSPTTMGSCTFISYGADDGTYGYLTTVNREDNANAFVYLVCNEGYWNGGGTASSEGNSLYLARVPRIKLPRLTASDYQFYTGGDGSLDANWSATQASAYAMISNTGELGQANVQFVPSCGCYMLLSFYYPSGVGTTVTSTCWPIYSAQHPWGNGGTSNNNWGSPVVTPCYTTAGYYNPVILQNTAQTGLTPTILFTCSFGGSPSPCSKYLVYYATMTITD